VGGRLDATNIVPSLVAVIAPISLEHTHILGATISLITKEKAAIIKSREQKVVIASQDDEATEVLEDRCQQWGIDAFWAGRHVRIQPLMQTIEQQTFTMVTSGAVYERCVTPLLGEHQRDNAAVVAGIVESLRGLGFPISTEALRQGFKDVFWPGRFEIVGKDPLVILDGAHNGASAQMLARTVGALFADKKVILILGVSKDKDKNAIHEGLSGIAKDIIYTKADHPRADDWPGAVDLRRALTSAYQKAQRDDIILVTGSVFVVSEARSCLLSEGRECIN
jgi:dihydrofolate synthase/folylpolyglutamate synthase